MAFKFLPVVAIAMLVVLFYYPKKFDPKSVRGKRVLITGSSSGIGEQIAYQYSKMGAQVVLTGRREENLEKVAAKCRELGAEKIEYVVADMGNEEERHKLVCDTEKRLGGLDYLILNHAIEFYNDWVGNAEDMQNVRKILETNLIAYMDIASKCLPMLTASKGSIGVVSSISAKIGLAYMSTHSMWKSAVNGFFTAFRQELKHKGIEVSVTFVILGYIGTQGAVDVYDDSFKNQNFARLGSAEEAAAVILKGTVSRSSEVYYPNDSYYYAFLSKFFPEYTEDYIGSNMHKMKHGL